jgi:hypothetical protein
VDVSLAFDDQSYEILRDMKKAAGIGSDAEMVRQALKILRTLQQLAKDGYAEVLVQHEDTGEQIQLDLTVLKQKTWPTMQI